MTALRGLISCCVWTRTRLAQGSKGRLLRLKLAPAEHRFIQGYIDHREPAGLA